MLHALPPWLVGIIAGAALVLNILFWVPFLLFFALLRLLLPFPAAQRRLLPVLQWIAHTWIADNSGWMALTQRTRWDVAGLGALGDRFRAIVDRTIVYPDGPPSFWDFLQGRLRRVIVRARVLPIAEQLRHLDYGSDPEGRAQFQAWVQQLWQEKDALIARLLEPTPAAAQ